MPSNETTITVTLKSEYHSVADLGFVFESLDDLTFSCLRTALAEPQGDVETRVSAFFATLLPAQDEWWFPYGFNLMEYVRGGYPFYPGPGGRTSIAFLRFAANAYLKRKLFQHEPRLYRDALSFAEIRRIEHHSPLLVELATAIGIGVGAPAALLSACMWVVYKWKKHDLQNDILDIQRRQQEEVLRHLQATTRVKEYLTESLVKLAPGSFPVSDQIITKLAEQITPTVTDFAGSPLIEKVSFGLSTK